MLLHNYKLPTAAQWRPVQQTRQKCIDEQEDEAYVHIINTCYYYAFFIVAVEFGDCSIQANKQSCASFASAPYQSLR